jgi:MFS family permease
MRVARAELLATKSQMGWIAAAPALGYLFATIWARQMEGRAKMPFVFWTWLFSRGLFLLTPLFATQQRFVLLVCITPIIFSISTPAYISIMKDIYPNAHRGRMMAVVRMGLYLFMLLASLVAGRIMDYGLDWRVVFSIGGVFGIMTAWSFSKIPVPPLNAQAESPVSTVAFLKDTFLIMKRNPGFRWFLLSVFVSGFGNLISATLIPIHQVDAFHVTNTQVANIQNIGSLATIVAFGFWGLFLDRYGSLAGVLLAVSFNLTVPFAYAFGGHIFWLYFASAAMGFAGAGIELSYVTTILMFAEEGKTAQYQALHSSFFGIRGSLAPHCAIPLLNIVGARDAFLVAFTILLGGAVLQAVSMRSYRKPLP